MWADNNTVREKKGKQKKCKDDQEIKTAMSERVAEVDWLWRVTTGWGKEKKLYVCMAVAMRRKAPLGHSEKEKMGNGLVWVAE